MRVLRIHFRAVFELGLLLSLLSLLTLIFLAKPNPSEEQLEKLEKSLKLDILDQKNEIRERQDKEYKRRQILNGVLKDGEVIKAGTSYESLPNYEDDRLRYKMKITGNGQFGQPYKVDPDSLSPPERQEYNLGWKNNAFNQYVSDRISLNRVLKDPRDEECKRIIYPWNMPKASVIFIFNNEAWSVLLRSVHSVINRTPPNLLEEIILVDDFSTMDHLKKPLDDYMARLHNIKIVRAKKREGLIRARLLGYDVAVGDVLIFLDSHVECAPGWIEPILARIGENKNVSVTPVIDVIDDTTMKFNYQNAKGTNVGGMDWSLVFTWHPIPQEEVERRNYKHHALARSPTMAGGLFAIGREFFKQIGTYDEGMEIWGAENIELSLRIWLCGGLLESAPCSHVGHIFRKHSPITNNNKKNTFLYNNLRLAEVWLDQYKYYYYQRSKEKMDYGDINSRVAIRNNLQCKPFEWFIVNVYPEMFIPGESKAYGQIRNVASQLCIKGNGDYGKVGDPILAVKCVDSDRGQHWYLTYPDEFRMEYGCIDVPQADKLIVYSCHGQKGNQEWEYTEDNLIRNPSRQTCLSLMDDKTFHMVNCDKHDERQKWLMSRGKAPGPVPDRSKKIKI